jgi:hypothetical protein
LISLLRLNFQFLPRRLALWNHIAALGIEFISPSFQLLVRNEDVNATPLAQEGRRGSLLFAIVIVAAGAMIETNGWRGGSLRTGMVDSWMKVRSR